MYLIAIFIILLVRFLSKSNPPPVLGIYRRPGNLYYLKVAVFYMLLWMRKLLGGVKKHVMLLDNTDSGYGIKSKENIEEMDCCQKLSDHPKAIDAVYFNLSNKDGWHLVVGSATRHNNVVNGFMYLKVPGIGLLGTPKLPDTMLFQNEQDDSGTYGAEGIKLSPFIPMKTWIIQYKGSMKSLESEGKTYNVVVNGVWNSSLPFFDFDTDMHPITVAKSISLENWNREYFEVLKDSHQTHYEQHGDFKGDIIIDEVNYKVTLNGVRDHSYGKKREWKNFHRYVLHYITLEDGVRMFAGVVCAPLSFSRLEIGYICFPDGNIYPLECCSIHLYQYGEGGKPPKDYGFSFKAGGKWYHVQVEILSDPEFYVGSEWEARVVEGLAKFSVNGTEGWGAAEWQYRHTGNRPENYLKQNSL